MKYHQSIFSTKELKLRLTSAFVGGLSNYTQKIKLIENWQKNLSNGKYLAAKEEEIAPLFLTQIFGEVLGYEYQDATQWNLRLENKTNADASKSDGALGFFKFQDGQELPKDVRAVIEIKDARTALDKPQNRKDFRGTAVEQAFMYAAKNGEGCKWVIVSNIQEIRLYLAGDMTKYEKFDLLALNEEQEFLRFYYLLAKGQLFLERTDSVVDSFLASRIEKEKNITKAFYSHYQSLRELFVFHLQYHNPGIYPLQLLEYAQTIMDRLVFIAVVKDYDLIYHAALKDIEDIANKSWAKDKGELWRQLKLFFRAIDEGFNGRLSKFNGGLFKHRPEIDDLVITDVFLKRLLVLNQYDFESDLNVNILGHIFEQSIEDLERLKKNLLTDTKVAYLETEEGIELDAPHLDSRQRKKEGVFYTPEFITRFVVRHSVGAWLDERKKELGLDNLVDKPEDEAACSAQLALWEQYKTHLRRVTVLDPACGSGVFLTQVFEFLLAEWQMVLDVIAKLSSKKLELRANGLFTNEPTAIQENLSAIKKAIVSQNLYGVDLNAESVEITKLGLWLKSASKNDELALLDTNIQCGNSLIADPQVSGKALDWSKAFPEIMQAGGFDIVLGNPPYVSANNMDFAERQYFNQNTAFKTLAGKWDLFVPFIEKSLQLVKPQGYFSAIVPYGLLNQPFAEKLRCLILEDFELLALADLHDARIFEQATVPTCIPIIRHAKPSASQDLSIWRFMDGEIFKSHTVNTANFKSDNGFMFRTERLDDIGLLIDKLKQTGQALGDLYYVSTGAEIHGKEQRSAEGELTSGYSKFEVLHTQLAYGFKPYIEGADIPKSKTYGRYAYPKVKLWLDYDNNVSRMRSPKFKALFESEKIVVRQSSGLMYILATKDKRKIYTSHKCILIIHKHSLPSTHTEYQAQASELSLNYLLALLNSRLMHLFYAAVYGGFIDVYPNYLKALPIPVNVPAALRQLLEDKVEAILSQQQALSLDVADFHTLMQASFALSKSSEKLKAWFDLDWADLHKEIRRLKGQSSKKQELEFLRLFEAQKLALKANLAQIAQLDAEIEALVAQVYGLSPEESELVKQGTW